MFISALKKVSHKSYHVCKPAKVEEGKDPVVQCDITTSQTLSLSYLQAHAVYSYHGFIPPLTSDKAVVFPGAHQPGPIPFSCTLCPPALAELVAHLHIVLTPPPEKEKPEGKTGKERQRKVCRE